MYVHLQYIIFIFEQRTVTRLGLLALCPCCQPCAVWQKFSKVTSIYSEFTVTTCLLRTSVTSSPGLLAEGEVGGWGRVPFSRNLMKPTPRRKWYLTTGRRFH